MSKDPLILLHTQADMASSKKCCGLLMLAEQTLYLHEHASEIFYSCPPESPSFVTVSGRSWPSLDLVH